MEHADIVGERYRLDRKIGQGGTGSIWLAHDLRLERTVAIKFLFARAPEHQERLARRVALEAKIAASIQHPNVVQIFDFGEHQSNIPYIVMEALSGFTLGAALDATGSFSLDMVIAVMSDVLRGLATVHHAGIVHRDLKPENIFLVKERDDKLIPKLLDFGISRSLEPDKRSAVTTTEGMIIGTPQYMSPEQARGLRDIDARTDLYSLGVVLFETLSGFVPFNSHNTGDLLMQVIRDPAQPLYELVPQIGEPLCHVVDKSLAKDRTQRYSNATDMQAALVVAARQIPSTLDRSERLFPPPAIGSRAESKRAGFEREFTFGPSDAESMTVSNPPAERGFLAWQSSSEAPTGNHRLHGTPPVAVLGVSDHAAFRGSGGSRRWTIIALAGIGLASAAVAATLAWTHRDADPDDSGFIIVQAPPAQPSAQPAAQPSVPVQAEPEVQAKPAPEPRVKRPIKSDAVDPMQLMASEVARAFARQKARVIGCLDAHPEDMQSAPQLTVNVTVSGTGKPSGAHLLPETIADKPVSSCVTQAVLSMTFPAQAQPTTFRVPLLWRRK